MVQCEFCEKEFETPPERYDHIMYGECQELRYKRIKIKGHYRWVIRDKKGRFQYSRKWTPSINSKSLRMKQE